MSYKVALSQMKVITGDLEGNTQRIVADIKKAIKDEADILVFPELCITGYNAGLYFKQQHFLDYQDKFLKQVILPLVPKNLVVILGFVRTIGKQFDGSPQIANSAAVIQGGIIVDTYDKILLAGGGHHDDKHYFSPGGIPSPIQVTIHGKEVNLGVVICEDAWNMDHRRNIPKEIVQNGAEILIVLNQSFYYYGKQLIRRDMYASHAKDLNVFVIAVGNVGVGDITKNMFLYDGGSLVVDKSGLIIGELKRFAEDYSVFDLSNEYPQAILKPYNKFEEIFEAIVYAQREIFSAIGFTKAQVHVSGGLDSSVTLPIIVEAMGAENVIAISNPSKYNGEVTKSNAQKLCDELGVKLWWEPIGDVQQAFINTHTKAFGEEKLKNLNISTFDAVGRTVLGIAASQSFGAGLVSTSNHTEICLNWFSWHDISTAAVYAPLADMTKVEIYAMAEYINQRYGKEIVPKNLYDGTTIPNPELSDATQGAAWNYFIVSGIEAMMVRQKKDIQEIVLAYINKTLSDDFFPMDPFGKNIYQLAPTVEEFEKTVKLCFKQLKQSVYKAAQACPPLMISPYARGFSNREPIINHYTQDYTF